MKAVQLIGLETRSKISSFERSPSLRRLAKVKFLSA
jgi:hypothetical protein